MLSAILGLQAGAFGVVMQTVMSGISELPMAGFLAAMQPIHLAIGIVEGLVTAGVVSFVAQAQPQLLEVSSASSNRSIMTFKRVALWLLAAAAVTGGVISWFASARPDGLEWAMFKTAGVEELEAPEESIHLKLAHLQEKPRFCRTMVSPHRHLKNSRRRRVKHGRRSMPVQPYPAW
jgi:cobalt/nickel transport system permease protein